METTLKKIAYAFQKKRIVWGIGGSYLLKHYGLLSNVNDIDIVVAKESIEDALGILDIYGIRRHVEDDPMFDSEVYISYSIEGIIIDVMCNIRVLFDEVIYSYSFSQEGIGEEVFIAGQKYPLMRLEDWYVLYYYMMRLERLEMIDRYVNHGHHFDFCRVADLVENEAHKSEILNRLARTY